MKKYFLDPSFWALLLTNILTGAVAVFQGWNILPLLWIYWIQSVVIGIFNFLRISNLEHFAAEGLTMNGRPVRNDAASKNSVASFFAIHYGFFHFGYLIFLGAMSAAAGPYGGISRAEFVFILLSGLLFLLNHLYSYIHNRPRDSHNQDIGTLMFYPYARIIPMHLTIIFGGVFNGIALPIFLLLKTGADAVMHAVERKVREGEVGVIH